MGSFTRELLRGLLLLLAIQLPQPPLCLANSAPDVLSITFHWVHDCAGECLDNQGHFYTTLADVLSCDFPVYNYCYCPTNTKSIDSIRSWLSQCVSTRCGAADFAVDVSAVQSGYASYCISAGYTQSGATTYFQPTPEPTAVPTSTDTSPGASPRTTTLLTAVTQTSPPARATNSGSPTAPLVTEEKTSTVVVTASTRANEVSPVMQGPSAMNLGIGLGLGLGIPLLLGCVAVELWLSRRRQGLVIDPLPPTSPTPIRREKPNAPTGGAAGPVLPPEIDNSGGIIEADSAPPRYTRYELSGDRP